MKVYLIKYANGTFKGLNSRLSLTWRSQRYGTIYKTVSEEDAAHYKTKGIANQIIKALNKRITEHINLYTSNIKETTKAHWNYNDLADTLKRLEGIKSALGVPVIIEKECEKEDSNLRSVDRARLRFRTNYNGTPINLKTVVRTPEGSKFFCKKCGVVLKDIPMVEIAGMHTFRVCAKCAIGIGEEAKRAWEALPEERRKNLDNDFFVHNLG